MSARYLLDSKEVTQVSSTWVGRPVNENEVVYALFPATDDSGLIKERWYVYGLMHDAIWVRPENLPEAVRLAHMLVI